MGSRSTHSTGRWGKVFRTLSVKGASRTPLSTIIFLKENGFKGFLKKTYRSGEIFQFPVPKDLADFFQGFS